MPIAENVTWRLRHQDADALAQPLAQGDIADWGLCDWYAVKALNPYITGDRDELETRARLVAGWATTPRLWQCRAAVVAFAKLAAQAPPFAGFADLIVDAWAANLVSDDRFAHTGPWWSSRRATSCWSPTPRKLQTSSRQRPKA